MADFVADGFLRFDLVPEPLNRAALEEMQALAPGKLGERSTGLADALEPFQRTPIPSKARKV